LDRNRTHGQNFKDQKYVIRHQAQNNRCYFYS
jgi:hypothetical protein